MAVICESLGLECAHKHLWGFFIEEGGQATGNVKSYVAKFSNKMVENLTLNSNVKLEGE